MARLQRFRLATQGIQRDSSYLSRAAVLSIAEDAVGQSVVGADDEPLGVVVETEIYEHHGKLCVDAVWKYTRLERPF